MLIVKSSRIHGTGCYAGRDFRKGEIIGEYTGERISHDEADNRYEEWEMTYLFIVDDEIIDATHDKNPVKYINHSCDPNCESEQDGKQILIRAIKRIREGDELTYDYCLDAEDDDPCVCRCGAKGCRGTMKAEDA